MPKKTDKKNSKGPEPFPEMNKAKEAFKEYKNRMAADTNKMGGKDVKFKQPMSGEPVMQPFMHMPQPPFQGQTGNMPHPFLYNPHAPYMQSMGYLETPLFSSLGNMLKLGVNLINAGLASGLQLIEGLSGGAYCSDSHASCFSCCEPCSCCENTSCCEPCDCCNPSVHNCC
jgi:hypothetical protein